MTAEGGGLNFMEDRVRSAGREAHRVPPRPRHPFAQGAGMIAVETTPAGIRVTIPTEEVDRSNLPVVEEVIDPGPVKACPEAWWCIGEEVTEQLDYEPAHFFKRRIVRRNYTRRDHPSAAPIIAPLDTLQDRCIAAPGLIAAIIVGKYCDHLPLYRQEQIFATRHNVQIPRQTLAQWMGLAADWLRPICETIRTGVLGGGYVQVDEPSAARQTPIEYLVPGNGQTKICDLWICARPGGDAVFTWHTSRAAAYLENIIPSGFRGTLQADGYSAYPAFMRSHREPHPRRTAANPPAPPAAERDGPRHHLHPRPMAHARPLPRRRTHGVLLGSGLKAARRAHSARLPFAVQSGSLRAWHRQNPPPSWIRA